ncbi:hypothetical protein [Paludisphaera mucosa]|uniref:Uncharacterized protein n=1 Tax=Paludisphaera mucosa TaxID=3030827 RepID=A0ABT6F6X3_9BACT|nr:hypothetical protein [Paludisphaera mucosa]MDG3003346.1 hypothetical protein [Paludisphaera mucosa]
MRPRSLAMFAATLLGASLSSGCLESTPSEPTSGATRILATSGPAKSKLGRRTKTTRNPRQPFKASASASATVIDD